MVPLLVIRTMVMIAIRISGMRAPPILREKTSLGFGHGTVVDIRTFMYEVRKQVKMKVSLRRKIHIIALPRGPERLAYRPTSRRRLPASLRALAWSLLQVSGHFLPYEFDPKIQVDNSKANRTSHTRSK